MWLSRLDERHAEIHEFVDELLRSDPVVAPEVCATLWTYWWQRGHMQEGRESLERAAALDGVHKAAVLKGLGTIAFRQGDLERAERAFAERFELVEAGERALIYADACADLARVALRRGDFPEVRRYAERGYEAAEGLDDPATLRERAALLVSCAELIFRETDSIPDPDDHVELDNAASQLREKLGERFETVWANAQRLGADDARSRAHV